VVDELFDVAELEVGVELDAVATVVLELVSLGPQEHDRPVVHLRDCGAGLRCMLAVTATVAATGDSYRSMVGQW
jgi:hypothetical protein